MRILMLTNRFGADARGGVERVIAVLAEALRTRGHDVQVVSRTTKGFHALHRMPAVFRALWHCIDAGNIIAMWSLARVLQRERPDIVHTHNLVGCGGLTPRAVRHYCNSTGARWVHTLHDVQLITPSGLLMGAGAYNPATSLERSFLGRWFRAFRRWLFGSPHVVVSPSRWLLALHRGERFFPTSRDAVVGNPASVPSRGRGDVRGGAIRTLLFIGQLEGHKGIVVLLEAYRHLRAIFPDVTLHVIGDGALLPMLKRATRDVRGLTVRGRLDANGIATALAHADLVVVPSICAENQPTVILEAFAAGVPVVASRMGGISEIVMEGATGFLVDPGNVEDLVQALRACIEDPPRVRAMRDACRKQAAAHDPSEVARSYETIYTDGAPH